ncbi:MAG: hypothetical protein ACR2PK_16175 [Acidimicrobiales bacterium]
MDRSRALALLALSESDANDASTVRRAYRSRLRQVHPDLFPGEHAAEKTIAITRAYRLLTESSAAGESDDRTPGTRGPDTSRSPAAPPRQKSRDGLSAHVLDESSILVHADRESTFTALLEAADSIGEIGYLDRSAWLVEVLVEFVEAPTSSVVMTLQGRSGGTEVFCTVEPLSGGDSPPIGPVTQLIASTLREPEEPIRPGG